MQPESKPRRKYRRYAKPCSKYLAMIACDSIVPLNPDNPNGKKNFWRVDVNRIPPNALRRHLQGTMEIFPDLSPSQVASCKGNAPPSGALDAAQVPLNPDNPNGKKNFWRVDVNRIPPNALRRHLQGTMEIFPDLSPSQVASCKGNAPPSGALDAAQVTRDSAKKFNSPFSIESLLKNTCSAQPGPKLPSSFDITSGFCLRENHSYRNLYSQADSVGDGYSQAQQTNDLYVYNGYPLPTPLHETQGAFHGYEERRVEANVDLSRQAQKTLLRQ
ncbi:UNVERIFIED_CONTAM: hypothetical protein FKN15_049665 [Acipenser sinensis]